MRRSSRTPEDEEPSLFDLPLEPERAMTVSLVTFSPTCTLMAELCP